MRIAKANEEDVESLYDENAVTTHDKRIEPAPTPCKGIKSQYYSHFHKLKSQT